MIYYARIRRIIHIYPKDTNVDNNCEVSPTHTRRFCDAYILYITYYT